MDPHDQCASEALVSLITGYSLSQAVYVAAKLGVPDLLAQESLLSTDLARATGSNGPALSRVLRLLAAAGVLAEVEADRFALTPAGELLRSHVDGSLRAFAIMTMELEFPAWGQLLHSVRTGQPGFPQAFGMPEWEYLQRQPQAAAVFDAAMVGLTRWQAKAVVAAYDFSLCRVVVDVGGGYGTLLTTILAAHPDTHGVLFDLPQVLDGAEALLDDSGVSDRCSLVGGDFLAAAVPPGGDTYVLKWIVHDWDDAQATAILRNCRHAMGADANLLLIERVVLPGPASAAHLPALWADIHMMVLFGGRERTVEHYARLLDSAGFRLDVIIPVDSTLNVIRGIPV